MYETYNTSMLDKHEGRPSIHPKYDLKLWLYAKVTSGLDMNQVYNIFMTMTQDIRADCCVLIVGNLYFDMRQQSPTIPKLVQEQIIMVKANPRAELKA